MEDWASKVTGLELGIWNSGCQSLVNPQNFKGETQGYVVKLPKSGGAGQYCPKIPQATVAPALTQTLIVFWLKFFLMIFNSEYENILTKELDKFVEK